MYAPDNAIHVYRYRAISEQCFNFRPEFVFDFLDYWWYVMPVTPFIIMKVWERILNFNPHLTSYLIVY